MPFRYRQLYNNLLSSLRVSPRKLRGRFPVVAMSTLATLLDHISSGREEYRPARLLSQSRVLTPSLGLSLLPIFRCIHQEQLQLLIALGSHLLGQRSTLAALLHSPGSGSCREKCHHHSLPRNDKFPSNHTALGLRPEQKQILPTRLGPGIQT